MSQNTIYARKQTASFPQHKHIGSGDIAHRMVWNSHKGTQQWRKETGKHDDRYDHQPRKCTEWLKYIG